METIFFFGHDPSTANPHLIKELSEYVQDVSARGTVQTALVFF